MTDIFTSEQRSRCMSAVHSTNTTPEVLLRSLLRSHGFRFRMNVASLPGKPDFVFPRQKRIIFVHGCFWHRHGCAAGRSIPSTKRRFWMSKLSENRKRDARQLSQLRRAGWVVLVIWQCQLNGARWQQVTRRIISFLQVRNPQVVGRQRAARESASAVDEERMSLTV